MIHYFFAEENLPEIERAGLTVQIGNTNEHEHIRNARGDERLYRRGARGNLNRILVIAPIPEAYQQIRTQTHNLPAEEQQQQVVGHGQQQHCPGEERKERKKARVHWLHAMVGRAAGHIALVARLAVIGIANAVKDNQETRQRHEKEHDHGQRVSCHAHAQGAVSGGQPGHTCGNGMLCEVNGSQRAEHHRPAEKKRQPDCT